MMVERGRTHQPDDASGMRAVLGMMALILGLAIGFIGLGLTIYAAMFVDSDTAFTRLVVTAAIGAPLVLVGGALTMRARTTHDASLNGSH